MKLQNFMMNAIGNESAVVIFVMGIRCHAFFFMFLPFFACSLRFFFCFFFFCFFFLSRLSFVLFLNF